MWICTDNTGLKLISVARMNSMKAEKELVLDSHPYSSETVALSRSEQKNKCLYKSLKYHNFYNYQIHTGVPAGDSVKSLFVFLDQKRQFLHLTALEP